MQTAPYDEGIESLPHPLDALETIASRHDWPFERDARDEMNVSISGNFCDYQLAVNWRSDLTSLHLAVMFDLRAKASRHSQIYELIGRINEQLWFGHFDFWPDTGLLLYRNTVLALGHGLRLEQTDELISRAISACEQFFPSFQYLIWAGQAPREALAACLFETDGNA